MITVVQGQSIINSLITGKSYALKTCILIIMEFNDGN